MLKQISRYDTNTLKQERGIPKTYEHNLLDEKSVVDRQRCHMAAKFDVFVDEDISRFNRYTGYQNFIKDSKSHVLLLTLAHVLLLSCQ